MNFLALLSTGQHDFSTGKDEQNHFWVYHTVDKARELLRFVLCGLLRSVPKGFKPDLEADIMRPNDVLNFEI